jgi:hypothetical protein
MRSNSKSKAPQKLDVANLELCLKTVWRTDSARVQGKYVSKCLSDFDLSMLLVV